MERLDLEGLGVARAHAALTGRPADDPRDVLTLYIHGDLNRSRSSRRLERETHRHVELIWLLRQLRPDFTTMADFRKHHSNALQALVRDVVLRCKPWDLYGAELLAIAGSQFTAVKSKHKNVTQATLATALKDLDEKMA